MGNFFPRDLVVPRKRTLIAGAVYWPLYLSGLSCLLIWLLPALGVNIYSARGNFQLNLTYFFLNFIAILLIFRRFLYDSLAPIRGRLGRFLLAVVVGMGAYYLMVSQIAAIYAAYELMPENINNAAVSSLIVQEPGWMLLSTVVLAPVTEECLCRGMLFGPICRKCPWLAYVVSSAVFAGLHIAAGISFDQATSTLILCFIQYLPAGVALSWVYHKTCSIWGSIALHALLNLNSFVYIMRFI